MSECCGPAEPCCGGGSAPQYDYGPEPFVTGTVDTFAGPVKRVSTRLTRQDRLGAVRMRVGVGRNDYRIRPGLYAVGEPDDTSPVLVEANYKLSFDILRSRLSGRSLWVLVLDTRGINVWCAAGKGTFGTAEVVRRVRDVRLEQVVSHKRLVVPQLGATGVAAHEVRAQSGFSVMWAPVRADDLGAFLDAGMKATPEMRRVCFPLRDRAKLVGVEAAALLRPKWLGALAALAVLAIALPLFTSRSGAPLWFALLGVVLSVLSGGVLMPLLLPWVPGRAFSLKGAIVGAVVLGATLAAGTGGAMPLWAWGLLVAGTALASFAGMNFTGSSTFTSPSGVEWEMRRAIPLQIAGGVIGAILFVVSLVLG